MKVIKKGALFHDEEDETASFDIPIDKIAAAFGISTAFFMGAFEAGHIRATAEEDKEGTLVITFRMGDMELKVGVESEDDEGIYPAGHA